MDRPQFRTLVEPFNHTFHCLLDAGVCLDSDYHVLAEPKSGSEEYTVAFRVDQGGKQMLIEEGRELGRPGNPPLCTECSGSADGLLEGFRAEVKGVVTALGNGTNANPPVLNVTSVVPSNGRIDAACSTDSTDAPTKAPTSGETHQPGPIMSIIAVSLAFLHSVVFM